MPLVVHHPNKVEPPWARYVAGVVAEMQPRDGFIGTVRSTLPSGVGLASSAALEVAVAVALGADLGDPIAVAEMCQRAEHRAVGVPCGIMDQFCIVAAVEDAALLLDCGTLDADAVPMPGDVEVAIIDSGQPRRLATSPYARRRAECAQVERIIGPLRGADLEDIDAIDDPVLWHRARHVITENQRVEATALALEDGDLLQAGDLMVASHVSLRDDYEVSTPRLDAVVDHLRSTPGVFGARLTGAGFGGSVVALCAPDADLDLPVVWRGRPARGATMD
jgi:galactokinase